VNSWLIIVRFNTDTGTSKAKPTGLAIAVRYNTSLVTNPQTISIKERAFYQRLSTVNS
jgi:hypothetical protein